MKFKCKKCGNCCKHKGFVFLELNDVIQISKFLEIKIDDFIGKFLIKDNDDKYHFLTNNWGCPFFLENECKIYKVRPMQCKSYPFWYYIVRSEKAWKDEAFVCKGIEF